ncbi:nucleotidyl transferase AbiEii/AbiGii toxin family protein [Candidatus Shapirobacteria bacterium]|nr:nucleotidyl transferase AbiEii/AbiGii toxin family protein [Candidatus Shapirobacteria bacterium]
MSSPYFEVLGKNHREVFQRLEGFAQEGVLGGGTALSLQIAHRCSYDFDIFTKKPIKRRFLDRAQEVFGEDIKVSVDSGDELSFLTPKKIKVSFIYFPFKHLHKVVETESVSLFALPDLASSKAYAIGRRGEYRDYVDLFFLLKKGLQLEKIIEEAQERFKGAFSEKLFLEQLIYFGDLKDFAVEFIDKKCSPKQVLEFFESKVAAYTTAEL